MYPDDLYAEVYTIESQNFFNSLYKFTIILFDIEGFIQGTQSILGQFCELAGRNPQWPGVLGLSIEHEISRSDFMADFKVQSTRCEKNLLRSSFRPFFCTPSGFIRAQQKVKRITSQCSLCLERLVRSYLSEDSSKSCRLRRGRPGGESMSKFRGPKNRGAMLDLFSGMWGMGLASSVFNSW
jgi:hypothetical protein